MQNSIIEYFSGHDGYKCGYCKSADTNFSHGMWAHSITPTQYEKLLNRGWRRSGKYLYKPMNQRTCCPCYTISCHALDFHISKSQKKILRKFNDYLVTGNLKSRSDCNLGGLDDRLENVQDVINYKAGTANTRDLESLQVSTETPKQAENNGNPQLSPMIGSPKRRKSEPPTPSSSSTITIPSNASPHVGGREKGNKKKFLRIQRKKEKLASQGLDPEAEMIKLKEASFPQIKTIDDFIGLEGVVAKHRLEIRKVKVGSPEFNTTFKLEHSLYQKYQMTIHNDEESECKPKQFRRFLCDNPLNEISEDDSGCYHHQYYVDDQLIAVGVVDVLPSCLSSVYFFYDPVFSDLTLGTFGALREIAFVRERAKTYPAFRFYYMGFYIHSCTKMRYKGNYTPSYLLCPETYQWKLLDDSLRNQLDHTKYVAFCRKDAPREQQQENINMVTILYRRSLMPYQIYELQRSKDDTREIQEYCNLVGGEIARNLCLYRSLN